MSGGDSGRAEPANALSVRVRLRQFEVYRAAMPRASTAAAGAPPSSVPLSQSRRRPSHHHHHHHHAAAAAAAAAATAAATATASAAHDGDDARHRVALVWPFDGTLRYSADVPLPHAQMTGAGIAVATTAAPAAPTAAGVGRCQQLVVRVGRVRVALVSAAHLRQTRAFDESPARSRKPTTCCWPTSLVRRGELARRRRR